MFSYVSKGGLQAVNKHLQISVRSRYKYTVDKLGVVYLGTLSEKIGELFIPSQAAIWTRI